LAKCCAGGVAEELHGAGAKQLHGFQGNVMERVSRTCIVCTEGQANTCKDEAGVQKDRQAVASQSSTVITQASLRAHALGLKFMQGARSTSNGTNTFCTTEKSNVRMQRLHCNKSTTSDAGVSSCFWLFP
jgi:hypothetical protein